MFIKSYVLGKDKKVGRSNLVIHTLLPGKQQAAIRTKGRMITITKSTHNHGLSLVASNRPLRTPPWKQQT